MTTPFGRAVNAAINALDTAPFLDSTEALARTAIVAAYPHLLQSLHRENRALKAEIARLTEQLSPTQ